MFNFSITPFIILLTVVAPVVIYLVVVRVKELKKIKVATQDKLDLILEETLKHDSFLRVSDRESKQLLVEIKETGLSTSDKLMAIITRVLNGKKHE